MDVTASVLGYFPPNSTYQPVTPCALPWIHAAVRTIVDGVNASALAEGSQIDLASSLAAVRYRTPASAQRCSA